MHVLQRTLRVARVIPAAMETMVCFSVKLLLTSLRTCATYGGLTARNTISLFFTTCTLIRCHLHSVCAIDRVVDTCHESLKLTSLLLSSALAPIEAKTSLRLELGSVAEISPALRTPFATKPLANASAICPAPMKPTVFPIWASR